MKIQWFLLFTVSIFLISCDEENNKNDEQKKPSREHTQPEQPQSSFWQVKDDSNGASVSFQATPLYEGKPVSHMEALWTLLAHNKNDFTVSLMRSFSKLIEDHKLETCGFLLKADPKASPVVFSVSGTQTTNCPGPIKLANAYDPHHGFANILHGQEHAADRVDSPHAVAFDSISYVPGGKIRRLIIPKGPYLSIYQFAKNGKPEELSDFFSLVAKEVNRLFVAPQKTYEVEVHSGSVSGQSVPHFHLRVYEP